MYHLHKECKSRTWKRPHGGEGGRRPKFCDWLLKSQESIQLANVCAVRHYLFKALLSILGLFFLESV